MSQTSQASFKDVFSNRPFVTLWVNQVLLQLSYNMLNFSLIILVFRLTQSNTVAALYLLMAQLPVLFFGVFAGVIADRFDKRKILLLTDLGIGLFMLLFVPFHSNVILILAIAFLLNIVFQFFIPAEAATLPSVVPKKDLLAANSIFQFTPPAALILGATTAGPVVANFGYNPVFIFGGFAMFATFFIRRALPPLAAEKNMAFDRSKETLRDLLVLSGKHIRQGFSYISADFRVWGAIAILAFIQASFSTLAVLAPGFMEQVLHIEATDASLIILLPLGVGIALGGLLTVKFSSGKSGRYLISRGFIICGLAFIFLSITPFVGRVFSYEHFLQAHLKTFSSALRISTWVGIFAALAGVGAAQVVIPAQTSLQVNTKSSYRGRVFALWAVLTSVGVTIPTLVAGAVADIFGIVLAMIAVGIVVIFAGIFALKAERILGKISAAVLRLR